MMSPYSEVDLLASDIHNWVSRAAHADREQGRTIPETTYLDRLASKIGVVRRQLYRYMCGEGMPTWEQIVTICTTVEQARAVEELARRCGLAVYRKARMEGLAPLDQVELMGNLLVEVGEGTKEMAEAAADGKFTPAEIKELTRHLTNIIDRSMALKAFFDGISKPTLRSA